MWMSFSHTISYILYGQKMRTVQQSIILFASLLLILLLVLIVTYGCDGAYDGTIIMNWYVVDLVAISVSICSHKDNYYTNIPNLYVQVGDAVDCSIYGIMLVRMTWYTDDSVTTILDDVTTYCKMGAMNNVSSDGNHMHDNNTTTSPSSLSNTAAVVAVDSP